MTIEYVWVYLFFLLLPLIWYRSALEEGCFSYSHLRNFSFLKKSWKLKVRKWSLKWLRVLSIALFIMALSRPRLVDREVWEESQGIDILLVLDISSSMKALDFKVGRNRVSRLDVVKSVVSQFVAKRKDDRIGMVVFAGDGMTLCPLTRDFSILDELFQRVQIGLLEDGTAIGTALSYGVNRLSASTAKSKVMILLTDGGNNAGSIDPLLAAKLAREKKIRIYTVGAGSDGVVPYPVDTAYGTKVIQQRIQLDEELLKKIANASDGAYFKASTTEELLGVYDEIDQLEKSEIKEGKHVEYREIFHWFLIPGLLLFLLEVFLANTIWLRIP